MALSLAMLQITLGQIPISLIFWLKDKKTLSTIKSLVFDDGAKLVISLQKN
jgi:hypothetical protein